MGEFKCYNASLKSNVLNYCSTQCKECERKELLEKSDKGHITEHLKEAVEKPFADYRENTCFSKEDMFLFAGFCVGYRIRKPGTTANEMFDVWCATFKSKKV